MKIIVGGYIGLYAIGGATWDYLQYPLGFHLLGHDVYYLEDTMQYPVYQKQKDKWNDCTACVQYLQNAMDQVGLKNKWVYRDVVTGNIFGMSNAQLDELCATADVFINISASTYMRDEYNRIPVKILVDSDPMFTQYQYYVMQQKGEPDASKATAYMQNYNLLFTFGLNINSPDCQVPKHGFNWIPTISPICMDQWESRQAKEVKWGFTSIFNWVERPPFFFNNESWGQKNVVFEKFITLPEITGETFNLVINSADTKEAGDAMKRLAGYQWNVLDPYKYIPDKDSYRDFIMASHAEFSITKEAYIKSNSGWFSCRSACYLAAGKPVITQDTKWSTYIPAGQGLFASNDIESSIEAIKEINSDYIKHARLAREIAYEYFDSNKVLKKMLDHL